MEADRICDVTAGLPDDVTFVDCSAFDGDTITFLRTERTGRRDVICYAVPAGNSAHLR
jgi:hypothetical protein